jgi:hypothetical protein
VEYCHGGCWFGAGGFGLSVVASVTIKMVWVLGRWKVDLDYL